MRYPVSVLLALAWIAYAGPGLAADQPFKVLSTSKVKGQVEAGLSEARDAKALAELWLRLGLKGQAPKVNFKQRMVVAWVGGGSACDNYVLTHVRENEDKVDLKIKRVRPPAGHMCIMIFSPTAVVASVPQTSKPHEAEVLGAGPAAVNPAR